MATQRRSFEDPTHRAWTRIPRRSGWALSALTAGSILAVTTAAEAAPSAVAITPPNGARFVPGQRFDVRVEGQGTGPFSATLAIDGRDVAFSSGAQGTSTTDGISAPGFGGFNLRGYSNLSTGVHTITASFGDATGSVDVSSEFHVLPAHGHRKPIKNVIILLGDGMGTAHRTAARLVRFGATLGDPNGYLNMDQFPATGLVSTHSLNSIVTDSAPGMAGYTTGAHAQNGQEGVYPANVTSPFFFPRVEYMSEFLHRKQGKSLGVVSTADLEDATPASNAIHTGNRGFGTGIMDQFLDESDAAGSGAFGTGLRVLLGGGRRWFLPAEQFGSSRAASTDYPALPADIVNAWGLPESSAGAADPARDLLGDFVGAGFTYVDSSTALDGVLQAPELPSQLLGLFAYGNMNVALDKLAKRRNTLLPGTTTFAVDDYHAPDQPMLDEMTSAALAVLGNDNPNGFVLLVEGAHIDKQSHAMDAERSVLETIEFDKAVGVARDFADNVDRSTVIIVLADHETSGFSIIGALTGGVANATGLAPDGAALDPLVQPERQKLVGTYDAAGFPRYPIAADGYPVTMDIDGKLLFGFGANGDRFETWLTRPKPIVDSLLPTVIRTELGALEYPGQPVNRSNAEGFFIRGQAVGRDQAVHTATDIPISAYSPRAAVAQQFVGVQRNTDVFVKLMRAALGGY
jgi:alkaline phosphatase